MRAFIAVEVPAAVREKVHVLIAGLKKNGLPVKWVDRDNLHITLKFLGEVPEDLKEKVAAVIDRTSKPSSVFTVRLSGLGCFPNASAARVLWIGVAAGGEAMTALAESLDRGLAGLGFSIENKRFHPHLTIGRVKSRCRVDAVMNEEFQSEPFTVDRITLVRSTLRPEGPRYDAVGQFGLGIES